MTEEQQKKAQAIEILRRRYAEQREQVAAIEERMTEYYDDLCEHSSAIPDDPNDHHNYYELLGAIRFLRLLRTYDFDYDMVRKVIRLREGQWQKVGNQWQHVGGGLKQPGTTGAQVYRWQPFQVYVLANVFGPHAWIDTELTTDDRAELLPTEKIVEE